MINKSSAPDARHLLSEGQITEAARLFGMLSEPVRLRLLRTLMDTSMTVTELVAATGCKQANVSKHLGILLGAGLVERSKEGTFSRYAMTDPFLKELCTLVCGRMKRHASRKLQSVK